MGFEDAPDGIIQVRPVVEHNIPERVLERHRRVAVLSGAHPSVVDTPEYLATLAKAYPKEES